MRGRISPYSLHSHFSNRTIFVHINPYWTLTGMYPWPFGPTSKSEIFWVTLQNAHTILGAWQNLKNSATQTPLNDISKIYSIFHIRKHNKDRAAKVWTNHLALPLSEKDWALMNVNLLTDFMNVNIQETSYKLSCRWYHTWTCLLVPTLPSQMDAGAIFQRRIPY